MGRFSQSRGAGYLVWAPAAGGVRVEYAATLFREVRMESSNGDVCGVLYGVKRAGGVRVVTARRDADAKDAKDVKDARLAGLEKVGIFSSRVHGDVSLTESDLERLEKLDSAVVALVIAGTQDGFFLRESGGAIHSIEGHRGQVAPEAKPVRMDMQRSKPFGWSSLLPAWFAGAAGAILLTSALTMAPPRVRWSLARPPLALTVREDAGQLRIAWTPAAIAGPATLEIDDGSEHRAISVPPTLANITYTYLTGDVQIRLVSNDRQESSRYLRTEPATPAENLREALTRLDAEAASLRMSIALRRKRVAELEKRLSVE